MSNLSFDRSTKEFGRSVSFFDAIYGFAITLLVTNVDPPPAESWASLTALWHSTLPNHLFGFLLSFTVIAVYWRVNFRLIGSMAQMNHRLISWNIVAAFFIILIPFTTQGTSDSATADLPLPTALYALNIALASLSQAGIYLSAKKHGLTHAENDQRKPSPGQLLPFATVPAVFLASIPVAFLAGTFPARLVWATLFIINPLAGRLLPAARPKTA